MYPGNHRVCTRCIMDDTAADIVFDEAGVCNYCTEFLVRLDHFVDPDPIARQRKLDELVVKVKENGRGKPYDCIIGVSGGVAELNAKLLSPPTASSNCPIRTSRTTGRAVSPTKALKVTFT